VGPLQRQGQLEPKLTGQPSSSRPDAAPRHQTTDDVNSRNPFESPTVSSRSAQRRLIDLPGESGKRKTKQNIRTGSSFPAFTMANGYSIFVGLIIIAAMCGAAWFFAPKGENQVYVS
jgi:hypothetical protein